MCCYQPNAERNIPIIVFLRLDRRIQDPRNKSEDDSVGKVFNAPPSSHKEIRA